MVQSFVWSFSSHSWMHFCYFVIISPLKRAYPFICLFAQGHFVPSLVWNGLVVMEKKILKILKKDSNFSPPWKGRGRFQESPSPKHALCQVCKLVEICPVILEEKMKKWNVYIIDDTNDNDDGQQTNFDQFLTPPPPANEVWGEDTCILISVCLSVCLSFPRLWTWFFPRML